MKISRYWNGCGNAPAAVGHFAPVRQVDVIRFVANGRRASRVSASVYFETVVLDHWLRASDALDARFTPTAVTVFKTLRPSNIPDRSATWRRGSRKKFKALKKTENSPNWAQSREAIASQSKRSGRLEDR